MREADRDDGKVGLLFIDLDRFKPVNDAYGHEAGDVVLKTESGRILSALRKSDTAARIGGDEFVVVIRRLRSHEQARMVAAKIAAAAAKPIQLALGDAPATVRIGASVGVAVYPDDAGDLDELLRRADQDMYRAKEASRAAQGEDEARSADAKSYYGPS